MKITTLWELDSLYYPRTVGEFVLTGACGFEYAPTREENIRLCNLRIKEFGEYNMQRIKNGFVIVPEHKDLSRISHYHQMKNAMDEYVLKSKNSV